VAQHGAPAEPVRIAEISAAAFRVGRVSPLLVRYLIADEEHEGAPPVIGIGQDEGQQLFGGDPLVLGLTLQIRDTPSTVVGVMPKGFGFRSVDQSVRLRGSDDTIDHVQRV
jgi:hypothetical protein